MRRTRLSGTLKVETRQVRTVH
ncbi:hypothetical protein CGRA01v4_06684 [Colletotrichum graminicola]|nr:hypothetical protein CGRA01v4_06684 [Colletotrichum graminicola]